MAEKPPELTVLAELSEKVREENELHGQLETQTAQNAGGDNLLAVYSKDAEITEEQDKNQLRSSSTDKDICNVEPSNVSENEDVEDIGGERNLQSRTTNSHDGDTIGKSFRLIQKISPNYGVHSRSCPERILSWPKSCLTRTDYIEKCLYFSC